MTFTRFLVAKYIADTQRMEPRNVGVIGWRDGVISGRFAGELEGQIRPPKIVSTTHRKGYLKAVQSWQLQFRKPSLSLGKGQDDALRSSPEFMEALKLYSTQHFAIGEGGHVTTQQSRTLASVVDELFSQLVDDSSGHDGRHKSALMRSCDELLEPLFADEDFHQNADVPCAAIGAEFPFTYTYGDDPERPDVLMQAVTIQDADQVGATAMKFRCFVEDERMIQRSQCACLVGELPNTDKMRRRLLILEKYCTIVSVAHPRDAIHKLSDMGLPLLMA